MKIKHIMTRIVIKKSQMPTSDSTLVEAGVAKESVTVSSGLHDSISMEIGHSVSTESKSGIKIKETYSIRSPA